MLLWSCNATLILLKLILNKSRCFLYTYKNPEDLHGYVNIRNNS